MGSGQMREWDMCVLESLAVTSTYRCLYDEQIPLRKKRRYVIVVAHAANRPANAASGAASPGCRPIPPATARGDPTSERSRRAT